MMMNPSLSALPLLGILAASLALPLQAEPILKGKSLSEKNLIQALEPPATGTGAGTGGGTGADGAEASPEAPPRMRSIIVRRDQPSARVATQVAQPAAARRPSASVLITFVTDSAELAAPAKSTLDVVARALQSDKLASLKFAIEGHADPRGTPEHNLRLSQERAESVANYLASRHHIDPARLKPVGKGASELFDPNRPEAPENRRVTIATLRE